MQKQERVKDFIKVVGFQDGYPRSIALNQRLLQQLPTDQLHAREVEWAFPEVALERNRDTAVAVQIAEPFAMLQVGKMGAGPVVHLRVPA